MYKLLALEKLTRDANMKKVIYPRIYKFWWKRLLDDHKNNLLEKAIQAAYYEEANTTKTGNEKTAFCL